jgi:uncharacterized metal-binding protein YceD (DUF177 family)
VKKARDYEIAYASLPLGLHTFEFRLQDSFFEQFATPFFSNAQLDVHLQLDKKTNLCLLTFQVQGTVFTNCHRCGDDFDLPIWDEWNTVAKIVDPTLVESMNEEDDDIVYFSKADNNLDLSMVIYEQVILCLPLQILHPVDAESGNSLCNPKAIAVLQNLQLEAEQTAKASTNNNTEEKPNPLSLQEQLKKIKTK